MTTERELREREWRKQGRRTRKRMNLLFKSNNSANNFFSVMITLIFLSCIIIAFKNNNHGVWQQNRDSNNPVLPFLSK